MNAPEDIAGVIIIVNDTMRRDRVGMYGGPARTPAFDAFARENLVFERAFTQSPWTKPAIATLFTSLYPSQHGVESDPQIRDPFDVQRGNPLEEADILADGFQTLAEVLRAAGYRSAAFVSNPWMEKRFGFDQGFDEYDDSFARWGLPGEIISRTALDWLRAQSPGTKFFLYLHYLDSHLPYGPLTRDQLARRSAELAADDRPLNARAMRAVQTVARFPDRVSPLSVGFRPTLSLLEMAYDNGVAAFDGALAQFLEGFAIHWAAERTAVIVTADHGEALFANGYGNHGTGLFDDEVAIPLAARLPEVSTSDGRVRCSVGLIDIMPTLCVYLGISCPDGMAGTSFLSTRSSERAPASRRYLVTEGVAKRPRHRVVRNGSYKLMWEPDGRPNGHVKSNPYALYRVGDDPGERHDLLLPENRSTHTDEIFEIMARALRTAVPPFETPTAATAPIDGQLSERLRALGYTE